MDIYLPYIIVTRNEWLLVLIKDFVLKLFWTQYLVKAVDAVGLRRIFIPIDIILQTQISKPKRL